MTSKQSLDTVFDLLCKRKHKSEDNLWLKLYETIKEDLEILELLKELPFEIYQNGGGDNRNWFIDTKQSLKISEETARKLKRWLENGN